MLDHISLSMIRNDLRKNKGINLTLFLFIFFSALLMSTGVLVINRLTGALDEMNKIAKPPHYLQMHVGDFDEEAVKTFAEETLLVDQSQFQSMFNMDGVNISFERSDHSTGSFSDSRLDNYFVTQNPDFDFLLNLENQVVDVGPGELGLPVYYAKRCGLNVDDVIRVSLDGRVYDFTVKTLVRDAQMGSSLASSIRFLISDQDFNTMAEKALRHETIIAFRLKDTKEINHFNELYNLEASQMPRNGVGITLPLINMVNGIGDGLMSGLIVLVGLILMSIAILSMRFTIGSTIEDEIREIGTLRAMGINSKDINKLYISKYSLFTALASLLAAVSSFFVSDLFIENISLNFGVNPMTTFSYFMPFIVAGVIYFFVRIFLARTLKNISKMSIISALVDGDLKFDKKKSKKIPSLRRVFSDIDLSLSLHNYRLHFRDWLVYSRVFFLGSLAIILPLSMYMTLTSPDFVNYVGAAKSDIRMSLEAELGVEETLKNLETMLEKDSDVKAWNGFRTIRAKIDGENGKMNFLVEAGDYRNFPVKVEEGSLPLGSHQIALSTLNADRLGKSLGDDLMIAVGDREEAYEIVGLYQDITNGGLTAKIGPTEEGETAAYTYFINLEPGVPAMTFVEKYNNRFHNVRVLEVDDFIGQTLGSITDSLWISVIAIFIVSLLTMTLISVLFINLRLYKNYSEDATLLALGYRVGSIRKMYLMRSGLSLGLGLIGGVLLALLLGERFMGLILNLMGFGLSHMPFLIQPLYLILWGVLVPIAVGLITTHLVTKRVEKNSLIHLGQE